MRESGSEGSGKGLLGGLVALLAVGGAGLARLGDDLGMVVATGARSLDDVAVGGALLDDAGRLGAAGALDDASLAARLGSADDGESLARLVGEAGLEVAGQAAALVPDGSPSADPPASGRERLDPAATSGPPVLAHMKPSPGPGPQYVLISRLQASHEVLAECVSQGQWCVVERVDSEEPQVIAARFAAHQQRWERERPTDADWVASLGAALPPGASAVWLAVSGDGWGIARPAPSPQK